MKHLVFIFRFRLLPLLPLLTTTIGLLAAFHSAYPAAALAANKVNETALKAASTEAIACPWQGARIVDGIWCNYANRGSWTFVDGVWWRYTGTTHNSDGALVYTVETGTGAWRTVFPKEQAGVSSW